MTVVTSDTIQPAKARGRVTTVSLPGYSNQVSVQISGRVAPVAVKSAEYDVAKRNIHGYGHSKTLGTVKKVAIKIGAQGF